MPIFFPDNIIDEVRDKCNIVEVISQYIPLKRAGRNFKAPCPFHQEKTPSFMVSPDKGIFHCFGCGVGGNVFNFVMKHERLEFPQVVRMLAAKTGVKLPAASMLDRQDEVSSDLFQVNEAACLWYQANLRKEIGRPALAYLKQRGFQANAVLVFRLGFAPDNNGLGSFMRGKGFSEVILEKAGLIIRRESGQYYDRFKQRLVFPIFDSRARVLGFGGRVLDNSLPKYMNSPETPVYNKGSHLYGLNFAKEEIKKQELCIIVEGYLDLLSVFQNGITNVVASLGTALTPQQIRLLKRYTHNVVMVFDADRAGEMATLRSLDLLIEEDVQVKAVSLPAGEDPDSFLRKFGREEFREKVAQAKDLFDYKLDLLTKSYNLQTLEGKVGIAGEMLPTIYRVQNAIRRSGYVKRLAQEFSRGERSLGEEWILQELKKLKKDFARYTQKAPAQEKVISASPAEEMVLRIILEDSAAVATVKTQLALEDFRDLRIREAMRVVYHLHAQNQVPRADRLIGHLGGEEIAQIISRLCGSPGEITERQRCLSDCIRRIKKDNLKVQLNRLQREIKLAENWGHKDKIKELVSEYNRLLKTDGERDEKRFADAQKK